MGRPYIGPVIDFRIPEDVKRLVEDQADSLMLPVDQLCREIFVAGVNDRFPARGGVLQRNAQGPKVDPPKLAVASAELASDLVRCSCRRLCTCNLTAGR
jgi:hypothetical protein